MLKVADALAGEIPFLNMLINPAYLVDLRGQTVLYLKKQPAFVEGKFTVTQRGPFSEAEEKLLLTALPRNIHQSEAEVHRLDGVFIPAHLDKPVNSLFSQLGFIPENPNDVLYDETVKALQENPGACFEYGDLQVVNEAGETTNILTYGDWKLKGLMEFRIIGQPAVFMRREVLAAAGYLDESYHYLLDHHLWLRMAMIAEPKYVPQLWAGEHYHPGSKNAAHAAEFGAEAMRIVEWMDSQPALAEVLKTNRRRVVAGAERLNAFYLFDARDYHAALRAYWRSLRTHPSAAVQDWRRILYAMFSPFGLDKTRQAYLQRRKRKYNKNEPTGS